MEYAILGRTGLRVSRLGFGCMRLPMKGNEVDREKAIPLLRRAVELGVNFFDNAVMYCHGDSQRALGEAMEGLRDRVILSTKNHHYDKRDKASWWKNLEDSLERLRTDWIDLYNFHGMNYERFQEAVDGPDGLYKEMLKAKEQGLIRHIGHSFHGSLESLKKCVDTGLFDSVILQYNLLDRSLEEGIAYAHEHGMGVIVMGPVGGGRLGYPSDRARELVGDVKSTPELALRFVLSNPNVTVALSGMSTMQMLEENVATASKCGSLTADDHARIADAVQERKKLAGLYCTGCGYCMPCPAGVDIPANFDILNLERVFGLTEHARWRYATLIGQAALCRLCGKCLEKCPQNLDIPARLSEAVAVLDERAGSVAGWGELVRAEVQEPGLVRLLLRYHMKNFTDRPLKVRVELLPHGEDQVAPAQFAVERLQPFGRRDRDVEVLARAPLESLDLDVLVRHDGAQTLEHLHYVATTARRAARYRLSAKGRRAGLIHVPGALHPSHGLEKPPKGHSFDFAVAHDSRNLYVFADVEDDLLCPAREPVRPRMKADCLRIYLDGRQPQEQGHGAYGPGVMSLSIYPPPEGAQEPQVRASNNAKVQMKFVRTPVGYRVDCAIPWKVFLQGKGQPDVVGFDIGLYSHDRDGNELVRLTWTGRAGQERSPGAFGKLLLL